MEIELPHHLPPADQLLAKGDELGRGITVGRTRLFERAGVQSELEYRTTGREAGQFFTAMNVGMQDWPTTVEAVRNIERHCLEAGVRPPDKYQLIPERRMGLPMAARRAAPQETGPMLWDDDDWALLGDAVEYIQPEVGDNIVGGPASVENSLRALRFGSTYVGCLSQFSWRWPYFDDDIHQISEVVTACGILASHRADGVVLDTYLEDGIAGTFEDYASLVGWADIERWIASLCGCPLSVSWGGLTADPITKTIVTLAIERGNTDRIPAAFVQGDTISYTKDLDQNAAICAVDTTFMMLVQARYRTGACALPVPLTELERVPTWEEIAQVQVMARQLERRVPAMAAVVDWAPLEREAHQLHTQARRFTRNIQEGLTALGVDTTSAVAVMVALSRLGAARIERAWGVGSNDDSYAHGRRPVRPTELVAITGAEISRHIAQAPPISNDAGPRVVVGSTDVHEMAKRVLTNALTAYGCQVVDIGVNRDPENFVDAAAEASAQAIVITTHNGVALSFGTKMVELCAQHGCPSTVYMGGVLNEDVAGAPAPVDVSDQLGAIGIRRPADISALIHDLLVESQVTTPVHHDLLA
jgi:methylmalonyl-CoA mutase cobalamin-binding subunit